MMVTARGIRPAIPSKARAPSRHASKLSTDTTF